MAIDMQWYLESMGIELRGTERIEARPYQENSNDQPQDPPNGRLLFASIEFGRII